MSRPSPLPRASMAVGLSALLAALTAPTLLAAAESAPAADTALRIEAGSVARSEVVALSRDMLVAGEALSDVVALDGSVEVSGRVGGDVIVIGGDARLLDAARVEGDLFVLGGEIVADPGAYIGGRTVSYPSVSRAWMTLLEGPSLGLPASSPLVIGAKIGLLCGWLALLLMLFATTGRELLATSESVATDPFRNFVLGLTAISSLVLTALFLTSFSATTIGLPMLFIVVFVALLLKLWGMIAVFHAFGGFCCRRILRRRSIPVNTAACGLLVLGIAKLLPWIGIWTWTVATIIGVGAALSTKLGRREPWLQPA